VRYFKSLDSYEMCATFCTRPWLDIFTTSPAPSTGSRLGVDFARASSGPLRVPLPKGEGDEGEVTTHQRFVVIKQDETLV
jgi:hypothetical protein